jgi:gluconolactonase
MTNHFDSAATGFARIAAEEAPIETVFTGMTFGEGPVWHAKQGRLYWTDIISSRIWTWQPGVGSALFREPTGHANGMVFDREGGLLVAGWGSRCIWRIAPDGSTSTLVSHFQGKRLNSPNDIVVTSNGTIFFTDPSRGLFIPGMGGEQGEDLQRYLDNHPVFRLDPDGLLTEVISDVKYPNGLCFSPDESVLYVNDTDNRVIRRWDVGPGLQLSGGDVFHRQTGPEPGSPDGMKVDVEGNVYVTGLGGIQVVAPSGEYLGRIRLPSSATNFCWGNEDWQTMYITTHSEVLSVRLGIPGVPVVIE